MKHTYYTMGENDTFHASYTTVTETLLITPVLKIMWQNHQDMRIALIDQSTVAV